MMLLHISWPIHDVKMPLKCMYYYAHLKRFLQVINNLFLASLYCVL